MESGQKKLFVLGIAVFALFFMIFLADQWVKAQHTASSQESVPAMDEPSAGNPDLRTTGKLLAVEQSVPAVSQDAADQVQPAADEDVPKKIYEIPLADPILVQ